MNKPMERIWITSDDHAELRCLDHPGWYADADGSSLSTAVSAARWHLETDHRAHVLNCHCRVRVTDSRCLPDVTL